MDIMGVGRDAGGSAAGIMVAGRRQMSLSRVVFVSLAVILIAAAIPRVIIGPSRVFKA